MPQKLIGNFINIVTKKYFCFNGRAGRAEFWLFFLAVFIVNTIFGIRSQNRRNPRTGLGPGNAAADAWRDCAATP